MQAIANYEEIMNWQIVDFFIDQPMQNIHKTFLKDAIGMNNIRPIAFGVRFWKKNESGVYEKVNIDESNIVTGFHFRRSDGRTKKIISTLYEKHEYDPETQQTILTDSIVYGSITADCTSVAGPFRLSVSVGDSYETLLRTIWIIEGNVAETESAVTF